MAAKTKVIINIVDILDLLDSTCDVVTSGSVSVTEKLDKLLGQV